eukprot:1768213-Pyramimonas_sp.AAC.1
MCIRDRVSIGPSAGSQDTVPAPEQVAAFPLRGLPPPHGQERGIRRGRVGRRIGGGRVRWR